MNRELTGPVLHSLEGTLSDVLQAKGLRQTLGHHQTNSFNIIIISLGLMVDISDVSIYFYG